MDIKSIREFTSFNIGDFEATIIKKFQKLYPPNFSSQFQIDDIDMRKGAVHGMSNAWKQRSMYNNPDRIERDVGIKYITDNDMLSIPEVKAIYDIKSSEQWIYQNHEYIFG